MAGLRLTVCLPAQEHADLDTALTQALEPFRIGCGAVDRAMWDWWAIRGGSDDFAFRVLPGYEHDARLIHDAPTYDGQPLLSEPGWCAGGPRGLLDFESPRAEARAWARSAWDVWHRLAEQHPAYLPFETFQERHHAVVVHSEPWERARRDYNGQPLLQAATTYREPDAPLHFAERVDRLGRPDLYFGRSREAFAQYVGDAAIRLTDLLTMDGWWIEENGTAMHATCEDATTCEHRFELNGRPADNRTHMESLPDDVLLVRVKCHV